MTPPLQRLIDQVNASQRAERSRTHVTLGELSGRLKQLFDLGHGDVPVYYEAVGEAAPRGGPVAAEPMSYRGYYSDLALPPSERPCTVLSLSVSITASRGATFTGYKGGDFVMDDGTPLWVSAYGDASDLAITDIVLRRDRLVLICEGGAA